MTSFRSSKVIQKNITIALRLFTIDHHQQIELFLLRKLHFQFLLRFYEYMHCNPYKQFRFQLHTPSDLAGTEINQLLELMVDFL